MIAPAKPKKIRSAEGRAKIVAALKKRWASSKSNGRQAPVDAQAAAQFPPEHAENHNGVQRPSKASIEAAASSLNASKKRMLEIAGVDTEEEFERLPKHEKNAVMAQMRGEQTAPQVRNEKVMDLALTVVVRSQSNREDFDDDRMNELVESVRAHGVIHPIIVRKIDGGKFEIVAGERRWRASQTVGKTTIPAIVRDYDDLTAEEIRLTENLQREDLRPMDEARSYQRLIDLGHTIDTLVAKLNRSKSSIYARLALLKLPVETVRAVEAGEMDASKADLISRIEDPDLQVKLTKQITEKQHDYFSGEHIEREMSFREAKAIVDQVSKELEAEKKWQERNVDHVAKGRKVLSIKASEKIFKWGTILAGYVRVNDPCDLDSKQRKWSELVGELQPLVAHESCKGTAILVYPRKAAEKALKEAGHNFGTSAELQTAKKLAQEKEKEREKEKEERQFAADAARVAKVVAAVESREPNAEIWRIIARMIGNSELDTAILKRRSIVNLDAGYEPRRDAITEYIAKADGKTLRGLVLEAALWDWNRLDQKAMKSAEQALSIKFQASGKGGK